MIELILVASAIPTAIGTVCLWWRQGKEQKEIRRIEDDVEANNHG